MGDAAAQPLTLAPAVRGSQGPILIVDDDAIVAGALAEYLRADGWTVNLAADADAALRVLAETESHAGEAAFPIICDISLPGMGGLELLKVLRTRHSACPVVMLTGYGTVESAVESLRLGACDYLTKPIVDEELRIALARAQRQGVLLAENLRLRRRHESAGLTGMVGGDARMRRVYELVGAVAPSRTTVLMSGESGTGKSLIAHAIHEHSLRAGKPFVELSCGSIPETLLESELFGHVKGAFTGAHVDKVGRFLAADGGTLFLDEINSASAGMQLKLLRVLQERRFEPVGSTQTVEVDVRVVLASNQPLEDLVARGLFRQDLYYRINVVKIELPPLREREEDVLPLAAFFLEKFAAELKRQVVGFTSEAAAALRRYTFPGNVRELQNIIERAAVLCKGQTVGIEDLPAHVAEAPVQRPLVNEGTEKPWIPISLDEALRAPERDILERALKANGWNRQKAAAQLGINRTTLYKKMKGLGLMGCAPRAG